MAVSITVMKERDAAGLVPELIALLADSVSHGASLGFMRWNGPEDYRRYWEALLPGIAAGSIVLLGAWRDGKLVGTAQLHPVGKPNQPHRADVAKVLVHSGARRAGIGAALMTEIEAQARRLGRDLLVLDTDAASDARRLYGRLGWTEVGTIPRYALMPDGSDCASTFFCKDLR